METDDYSNEVFLCLDALKVGRANSGVDELDDYQRAVLACFQTMTQGPTDLPMADMNTLLHRLDDLIDTGTDAGARASGLVETLYEVHGAVAAQMEKAFEDREAREVLRRYLDVGAAMRSPVLRSAAKRAPTVVGESRVHASVHRIRALFHKGDEV